MHIALVTESRYERPTRIDAYIGNILEEDRLLTDALARHGAAASRVDWAREDVDWARFDAAVFRTTWDYFRRLPTFLAWLDRVEAATRWFNPVAQVRWNLDKHYLTDLNDQGVRAVPTRFVEAGSDVDLQALMAAASLDRAIVKPAISGGARHTWRVDRSGAAALQPKIAALLAEEALMVQPFLDDVVDRGEVSLIAIAGAVTHAVLKRARHGDFRVQDDHGGTVHPHAPTAEEIAFAEAAVAACSPTPVYARVDMVRDHLGRLCLMELELIEPELFFRAHPPAADRLAAAVVAALRSC